MEAFTPRIGIAGWAIPKPYQSFFPEAGTHLEKYAKVFNCVEINSCFYREHQPKTYGRWAESTPDDFLFSVKLLKHFTHEKKLTETGAYLEQIIKAHQYLGKKWGALIVQLPPTLNFDAGCAGSFFDFIRNHYQGNLYCEPRHKSWLTDEAFEIFERFNIHKVIADPDPCFTTKRSALTYLRLHGSPEIYKSSYSLKYLQGAAKRLRAAGHSPWCIFDNTTYGYSIMNAIELKKILQEPAKNRLNEAQL